MPKICSRASVGLLCLILVSCGHNNNGGNGGPGGPSAMTPTIDLSNAVGALVKQSGSGSSHAILKHNAMVSRALQGYDLALREYDINVQDGPTDGSGSLVKTDGNGNISPAISVPASQGSNGNGNCGNGPCGGPQQSLPFISVIAVSPVNEVFVEFAQPFRFVNPTNPSSAPTQGNPWGDGTYCQIFRVKGGTVAQLKQTPPTAANLECMDFNHFIQNYNGRGGNVFQFDSAGNAYYPGQLPNSPVTIVYKWDRATGTATEMINGNICVQDYLVTPSGGLFYTGQTCQANGPGGGGGGPTPNGGFFRYVSAASVLTQIAQDWWNFIYQPVSTATNDKAVFYGPDPTSASVANWNSACLFYFDPSANPKTSSIITCDSNIWTWVNMQRTVDIQTYGGGFNCINNPNTTNCMNNPVNTANDAALLPQYTTEFARRCASTQSFAGGGSQISNIKEDSNGNIFVIGDVQIKQKGTFQCGVQIKGPHCKVNGIPDWTYGASAAVCATAPGGGTWVDNNGNCSGVANAYQYTTSATCIAASGTWNGWSQWYNSVSAQGSETHSYCDQVGQTGYVSPLSWTNNFSTTTAPATTFTVNNLGCQSPSLAGSGDGWTSQFIGMAVVDTTHGQLNLISSQSEQALDLWVIRKDTKTPILYAADGIYYSSFNVSTGQYSLNNVSFTDATHFTVTPMKSNFEVYNLSKDGLADASLYFDGLDFSNNSYTFGTIQTASPFTTKQQTGFTGTLKQSVYLGEYYLPY